MPTWREWFLGLRSIPPFLRLVWETHRGYAGATVALRLLRAGVPIATLWVAKLIIDTVVAARTGQPDLSQLWLLVGLELIIVATGEVLAKASTAVEGLFGDLCSNHISEKLIRHAATLDLRHFEDPAFYDRLERAQRQTTGRIGLLPQLLSVGQDVLTLASLAAAVFVYSPWLLALLLAAVLPGFLGETHFSSLEYSLLYRRTPERRLLDYLRSLSAGDKTAKEVQMFGLGEWLLGRYRMLAQRFYEENKRLALRKGVAATGLSLLGTLGYYAAYAIILWRGFYGIISIGTLTFLAAAFARSRALTERVLFYRRQHLRAGPLHPGPVRFLPDATHHRVCARRAIGARPHSPRVGFRGHRLPVSGQRHVGTPACESSRRSRREDCARGRERGRQDYTDQALGPAL